jgi:hypothetical protein
VSRYARCRDAYLHARGSSPMRLGTINSIVTGSENQTAIRWRVFGGWNEWFRGEAGGAPVDRARGGAAAVRYFTCLVPTCEARGRVGGVQIVQWRIEGVTAECVRTKAVRIGLQVRRNRALRFVSRVLIRSRSVRTTTETMRFARCRRLLSSLRARLSGRMQPNP